MEPKQIESALAAHPSVTEVVVFLEGKTALEPEELNLSRRLGRLASEQAEALLQEIEVDLQPK